MNDERITIRLRRDTDGNPAPVLQDGHSYAWIGTRYAQDGTPLETAWGRTAEEVKKAIAPTHTPSAAPLAGHTPGPWTVRYDTMVLANCDGVSVPIAQPYNLAGNATEQQANARLIAAAPALLAERDALRVEVAGLREIYGLASSART